MTDLRNFTWAVLRNYRYCIALPWRCGKSGPKGMYLATVPYATTIEHDGRAYRVEIPARTVPQCKNCQAISIDNDADHEISAAFRRQAGLLVPQEIRQGAISWG